MNFNDYLWDLLTRPFRREGTSEIKLFFSVVGGLFDRAKQTVFLLRRQWIVLTASEDALRLLGAERGIFRTDSESLANYRRRVSAAYMIYAAGGTHPGIINALQRIGYTFQIAERKPTWAKFTIYLWFKFGLQMSNAEYQRLDKTIFDMKPAHTLPVYVFDFMPEPGQRIELTNGFLCEADIMGKHDFWWTLREIYRLDGSLKLDGSITLGDGWATVLILDGSLKLDGSSLLDGNTKLIDDGWRWTNNVLNRSEVFGDMSVVISFPERSVRLDGKTFLDGSLKLDGQKECNTLGVNIKTAVERIDAESGISNGLEVLQ